MSFIDGIVNGVRNIFGGSSDSADSTPKKAVAPTPTGRVNRTVDTSYKPSSNSSTPSLSQRFGSIDNAIRSTESRPSLSHFTERIVAERSSAQSFSATNADRDSGIDALIDSRLAPRSSGNSATAEVTTQGASSVPLPSVRVYDSSQPAANGAATLIGDATTLKSAGPQNARTAAQNVERGFEYLRDTFGRNGLDGAGSGVSIVVNDRSTDANGDEIFRGNGGYYATRDSQGGVSEAIRFGTGTEYNHARGGTVRQYEMLYGDDLAIHELMHGVMRKELGVLGGGADEAGSTNEAVADVLAASATRDWRIGEKMYADDSSYRMMRNIANPNDATAVHVLWDHIDDVNSALARGEEAEEHYASGIVSTAAARAQQRIGGERGWQAIEQIFYHSVDTAALGSMSYADVARGLRSTAQKLYGQSSDQYRILSEELQRNGL